MMLVESISRSEGAHSYEFSQTSELVECLTVCARPWVQEALTLTQGSPLRQSFLSLADQQLFLVQEASSLRPRKGLGPSQPLLEILHVPLRLLGSYRDPEQIGYAHVKGNATEDWKGQHLRSQTNHFGFWFPR